MLASLLRQQLAALQPPPSVGATAIPTGIPALDRMLSGGGLPSGRLTEILGRRGSGRTTLVRQLVTTAVTARRQVAVIDGRRTLVPRDWASIGDTGRLWVVRPPGPDRGAWCADILLRSGAFGLVVLDGVPVLPRPVAIRLTRLAREHDAAFVVTSEDGGGVVGSAVRLRITKRTADGELTAAPAPGRPASRAPLSIESRMTSSRSRITIAVEKGGLHHSVEVCCATDVAHRLCAHPEVPDRRGVAPRNRQGERVASPHRHATRAAARAQGGDGGERGPVTSGTLPYKRRCAEPLVRRESFLLAQGRG